MFILNIYKLLPDYMVLYSVALYNSRSSHSDDSVLHIILKLSELYPFFYIPNLNTLFVSVAEPAPVLRCKAPTHLSPFGRTVPNHWTKSSSYSPHPEEGSRPGPRNMFQFIIL
jgi:hypothetical protein